MFRQKATGRVRESRDSRDQRGVCIERQTARCVCSVAWYGKGVGKGRGVQVQRRGERASVMVGLGLEQKQRGWSKLKQ